MEKKKEMPIVGWWYASLIMIGITLAFFIDPLKDHRWFLIMLSIILLFGTILMALDKIITNQKN